jgi:protoporphyrinogen oxidase
MDPHGRESDRVTPSKVIIIGAGPAGLTAAWRLSQAGVANVVLEKDGVVGGISRTAQYKGYLFDIGGHRFFTKVGAVLEFWREALDPADFLERPRLSRIYYNKRFFPYPLRPVDTLRGLGLLNSALILVSYLKAQLFPARPEETFEQWVSNRFGKRLFRTFFKTYTEKVWGLPCDQIRADWAAQRIKGLSLYTAVRNALLAKSAPSGPAAIKTLIHSFQYPRRGPGMMWERVAEKARALGTELRLDAEVAGISHDGGRVTGVTVRGGGRSHVITGSHFLSTMAIRDLLERWDPPPPPPVREAAGRLKYRDFITVALIVDRPDLFPDNWIYIHDPEVKVGRIQNFKNWSPEMVPDPGRTCLGLEYFCFEGDGLWTMDDRALVALATAELERLGLAPGGAVLDGAVVRMPKAYPVYDTGYQDALRTVREYLLQFPNLQLVGRNGMHRYNNQDHSMYTALLAVQNILGANHDLWSVNADEDYHEETRPDDTAGRTERSKLMATQPRVPEQAASR